MDTTTKEVEAQQSSGEPTNEAVAPVVENTTGNTTGTTETPIENQQPTERSRKHLSNSDDDDDRKDKDSEDEHDQRIRGISVPDSSGNDTSDFGSTATKRQLLEDKLDRILKKPKVRRTRRDEDDLEQYQDEKILRLKDEMNIAAQLDIDTLNSRIDTGNNSLIISVAF